MPPKRRGTRAKAPAKLSPEDQQKRDQCDLLLKDFDQNRQTVINESKRDMETVVHSMMTMYKLELMKIPNDVKNSNWIEYYKKSLIQGVDPLNVSNAINSCMDDSICTKVDDQVSQLKSAMKTAKKRGRTAKENVPSSAVRASSRKRTSPQTQRLSPGRWEGLRHDREQEALLTPQIWRHRHLEDQGEVSLRSRRLQPTRSGSWGWARG